MRLVLRKAKGEDISAVLDIAEQAFTPIHESFKNLLGERIFKLVYPNWVENQSDYIKGLFKGHNKEHFFIGEIEGKVVCFISLLIEYDKYNAEIGINAVHPEYHRRGFGMQMYKYAFNYMKSKNIKLVEVSTGTDDSHIAARAAYKKAGFISSLSLIKLYKEL